MTGVNCAGTEEIMEHQSCLTIFLSDDVIQNLMLFENSNIHSPKKQEC